MPIRSILARAGFRKDPSPPPTRDVPDTPEGRLGDLFDRAEAITVLTGAGLSVPSGLPAYRDENGFEVAGPAVRYRHFLTDPEARLAQWRWSLAHARAFAAAEPNAGHAALAEIAARRNLAVVTQNVDGLHARSGLAKDRLVELHGRGDGAACARCGHRTAIAEHAAGIEAGVSPTCPHDGNLLKPTVTLFGEAPLRSSMMAAEAMARSCDLFLVVGTSLSVTPAGYLPSDAHHSGAVVAVVNPGRLRRDAHASVIVAADAAGVLGRLASRKMPARR